MAISLKEMLQQPGIIIAPGCYDAHSARLIEQAGFKAVYVTGYGASASLLGKPDVGLLTMTEMVNQSYRIAEAVNVPVIADADTGYGNPLNVYRTVKEYLNAGVSAIQLEDQVVPKRCGHTKGKSVIPTADFIQKLRAAIDARGDGEMLIIARTDARAVYGLEEAIARARVYREVGADVIFVEAPTSYSEYEQIHAALPGVPLLANMVEGGKSPLLTAQELERVGCKIVIYPAAPIAAATLALQKMLKKLKEDGTTRNCMEYLIDFDELCAIVGFPEFWAFEKRYSS